MSGEFENLIMRDTRANQPAAGVPGRLYYVTDENVTERDNGSAWEDYSDGGSGGGNVATDTIWDTKGDLAVATGADAASKLAAGSNGQKLVADSSQTTGLKWVSGGRELIGTSTPSGTGTVTFSSIPSTYNDLEIVMVARSTKSAANSDLLSLFLNNDTTAANYRSTYVQGHSSTTVTGSGTDTASPIEVAAASSPSNSAGLLIVRIPVYKGTTFNKQMYCQSGWRYDASSIHEVVRMCCIEWESNAAINRVDLVLASGNYVAGSEVRLYGLY
jgi:hypothetical protein